MRAIFGFLAGLLLLGVIIIALGLTGAVYDTGDKSRIQAVMFQPDNLSANRLPDPVALEGVTDAVLRDKLVKKFLHEFFYAIPDVDDVTRRTRRGAVLSFMSTGQVFEKWKSGEAAAIKELAGKKILRRVAIGDEIIKKGDYYEVRYELHEWDNPNIIGTIPTIKKGTAFLKLNFEHGIRSLWAGQPFDAQKYLETGMDPAAVFKFEVSEIITQAVVSG